MLDFKAIWWEITPTKHKKTLSAHLPLISQNHLQVYRKHHIKKSRMNLIRLPCN